MCSDETVSHVTHTPVKAISIRNGPISSEGCIVTDISHEVHECLL